MRAQGSCPYAAIYARVSTEDQGKGFSIPTQIEACQKVAEHEGYTVPEAYILVDAGISGATLNRPGLSTLRELVASQAIAAVVIYDVDRLSRSMGHLCMLVEAFEQSGVKLLGRAGPIEQTPEGTLLFQMQGAMAQYVRANIREGAKRGMRGRAQKGHPNGGQVPLGYRYIAEPHGGRWEVDDEEEALVRRIFAWCLAGTPVRAIARQLTAEGIQTRLDRRPKSGGKKRNSQGVWTCSSIHQILRNETYTGRAYFGRKQRLTKTVSRLTEKEAWILVEVPAILDDDTFRAAHTQLQHHQVTATRNRRHDYLLAGGFLRCAMCGRMMTGRMTSRGKRRYRCTSRNNVLDVAQRCRGSLAADDVEARIWLAVEQVLHDPTVIAQEVQRQHEHCEDVIAARQRDVTLIDEALVTYQREDERWTKAYAAEEIELGELKAYRAEIQQRRQALQEQQAQYEAEVDHLKSASDRVDQLIDYCARVQSRLQTFSCAEKRTALQALAIHVAWAAEQPLTVQGSIPVDGAIVSSTANGVMRPPFSAGSNQAGGS